MSRGFIVASNSGKSQEQVMEEYYRNGRMLMSLAGAVGRLVLAGMTICFFSFCSLRSYIYVGRELTRLAGFTARVTELVTVLKELDAGEYKRSMLTDCHNIPAEEMAPDFGPNKGKIIVADHIIKFENVPLVTPNADVLIRSLTIEVHSGQNVLVAGPNGCGKSSVCYCPP
jgi:ATP-binding cassette, subfamily D (ALD), member 3